MKNTLFKSSRFVLVARKYYNEEGHTMLLRLATLFGIMIFVFCFNGIVETNNRNFYTNNTENVDKTQFKENMKTFQERSNRSNNSELAIGIIILFAFGIYIGSTMMEHTDTKAGRISLYTQPATYFEKYFVRWLAILPIFLIIYALFFVCADMIRTGLCVMIFPNAPDTHHVYYDLLWNEVLQEGSIYVFLAAAFLASQSAFMLGSAVYRKNAFVKTFVSVAIIILVAAFVSYLTDKFYHVITPLDQVIYFGHHDSDKLAANIAALLLYTLTAFNWLITYIRFKENDVLHRLL
jgi:hypothetical protein